MDFLLFLDALESALLFLQPRGSGLGAFHSGPPRREPGGSELMDFSLFLDALESALLFLQPRGSGLGAFHSGPPRREAGGSELMDFSLFLDALESALHFLQPRGSGLGAFDSGPRRREPGGSELMCSSCAAHGRRLSRLCVVVLSATTARGEASTGTSPVPSRWPGASPNCAALAASSTAPQARHTATPGLTFSPHAGQSTMGLGS